MSDRRTEERLDARLNAFLEGRAEDAAARARTPEQVAAEIERWIRPGFRLGLRVSGMLRLAWLVMVGLLIMTLLAWLISGGRLPSVVPTRIARIAIDLPLGGGGTEAAAIVDGIKLAVDDSTGATGRFQIELPTASILSDLAGGVPDAGTGAANVRRFVADADVVAVIGPFSSFIAQDEIPISHAAGLLQCSPANTDPGLTRLVGVGDRPTGASAPSGVSYIRTVTTDDVAAAAAARYLHGQLGKTTAFVLDDHHAFGVSMADWFSAEFTKLGGTVTSRASLPDSDAAVTTLLATARAQRPQSIYFGGSGKDGASVLKAAQRAGLGNLPFLGTDALHDGNGTRAGSFLSLAGPGASRAFSIVPGSPGGPQFATFAARYRARYGADPTPFASAGYACVQVVIAALRHVDAGADAAAATLRNAVRAAGVDTTTTFQTVLGPIAFDTRGDVTPGLATIYAYDPVAGDWAVAN